MGKIRQKLNAWMAEQSTAQYCSISGIPTPTNGAWLDVMLKMPGATVAEHDAAMGISEILTRVLPVWGYSPQMAFRAWPDPVREMPQVQVDMLTKIGGRAGLPDWVIAIPSRGYHGLFVEQKVAGRQPRTNQIQVKEELKKEKYGYTISRSLKGFLDVLIQYLEGDFHPTKRPIPEDPEGELPRRYYDHV